MAAGIPGAGGTTMGTAAKAFAPPLTEPVPVEDTFVTGLGRVEKRGDFVRLDFVAEGDVIDGTEDATTENRIVSKIVLSPTRLRRVIRQLQAAMEDGAH